MEVAPRTAFYALEEDLRRQCFVNDVDSGVICRWTYNGLTVDAMPTEPEILDFSNCWYPGGFAHAHTACATRWHKRPHSECPLFCGHEAGGPPLCYQVWAIETALHWQLDVTFGEDDHRLREHQAAQNLTLVRKMALNRVKKGPTRRSIKNKRKCLAWDELFLEPWLAALCAPAT